MAQLKVQLVEDIHELPPNAEICRDEDCPVVEAHLTHPVHARRGRPSSSCPNCLKPVHRVDELTVRCGHCGWSRRKEPAR